MTGAITVKAIDRLAKQNDPFSITVSFHSPHSPMVATENYYKKYNAPPNKMLIPLNYDNRNPNSDYKLGKFIDNKNYKSENKNADLREFMLSYYALVDEVDHWVGEIMKTLEKYPEVRENTIIIYTTDHGEMLGAQGLQSKGNFYEESVHVPFIMNLPKSFRGNTVVDTPISTRNIYATIMDYTGNKNNCDSPSLRNHIKGKSFNESRDEEYSVSEWDRRTPVENPIEDEDHPYVLDVPEGEQVNFMVVKDKLKLTMSKTRKSAMKDMLFNLEVDPQERENLIGDNATKASIKNIAKAEWLRALLLDWMKDRNGKDKIYDLPK